MNTNPEFHHNRAGYIHQETTQQHKKRVLKLKSIFRYFLNAKPPDKKIKVIAEKMDVPENLVLQAITEGLNRAWK
jgi:hypothetical protein